jgi:hypothetical protein
MYQYTMSQENFEKPAMTPLDALQIIEESFLAHLADQDTGLTAAERDQLAARVRARMTELADCTAALVENDLDRGNVGFVLLAVAAYDVLSTLLPADRAMALVDMCLNEPMRPWVLAGVTEMLDASPDPFVSLTTASRHREEHYFGPSFAFERPVDDGFGYVLNIRRCLFHEALKACGRTELQPVLCRFDLNWIDGIAPERHHMRFARPSTFATADLCRMWFMRLEPPASLLPADPHAPTESNDHGPSHR